MGRLAAGVDGRARRLVRAVAYAVGFTVPVALLAFLVRERFDPILDLDEAAIRSATGLTRAHPGLLDGLVVWQAVLQPKWVYLVAVIAAVWVWRRHHLTSRAWWAILTMMVAWNLALDVKLLVQRARPVVVDAVAHAPGYSFPSGHATGSAAAATTMVVLVWPLLSARWRPVAVGVAVLLIIATAADRVFLGVHYPSDVVAGVILGCGISFASYAGYLGWKPARPPEPEVARRDVDPL